jgi:hypothetical protein
MHPWIPWQPAADHVGSAKHTFLTAALRHIYVHNIAWLNIRESKFFSQNVLCDTGIIILSKISRITFVIQTRCFSSALRYRIFIRYWHEQGAPGGTVGWGTALQVGKMRVRFPMVWMGYSCTFIVVSTSSLFKIRESFEENQNTYFIFNNLFPQNRWRWWLRPRATSQKVADSIPDGVIRIFHWHNPSGRTMALGST